MPTKRFLERKRGTTSIVGRRSMATEKQYSFYKLLFDEEFSREKQLRDQAKTYLSLSTLYSAFVVAISAQGSIATYLKYAAVLAILFMALCFVFSLMVMQTANYEAITVPEYVTEQFGDEPMEDEEFFDFRIADFTAAYEQNSEVNDRKAIYLSVAGYALMIGIFLHAGFFVGVRL
jgi:hypothetical protein